MRKTLTLSVSAALMATTALAQDKEVTIASWGGSYQEAQSKALFEPAAEKYAGVTLFMVSTDAG